MQGDVAYLIAAAGHKVQTRDHTRKVGGYLAYVGLDLGPGVLNLVCQHCIIHHLLELVPDGVAQVASCSCVCQVVVPAGKHHSGEGKQPIAAHKSTVSFTLCICQGC